MKYTICSSFPRSDDQGSGARPNIDDMQAVIKLRFDLEADEGPYPSLDGTAKFCFVTDDATKALALIRLMAVKGIGGYWYDDDPSKKQGEVCYFGSILRWDKVQEKD
jgi:hypothetical protein